MREASSATAARVGGAAEVGTGGVAAASQARKFVADFLRLASELAQAWGPATNPFHLHPKHPTLPAWLHHQASPGSRPKQRNTAAQYRTVPCTAVLDRILTVKTSPRRTAGFRDRRDTNASKDALNACIFLRRAHAAASGFQAGAGAGGCEGYGGAGWRGGGEVGAGCLAAASQAREFAADFLLLLLQFGGDALIEGDEFGEAGFVVASGVGREDLAGGVAEFAVGGEAVGVGFEPG